MIDTPPLLRDRSYLYMLLSDRLAFRKMVETKLVGNPRNDLDTLPPALRESYGQQGVIRSFERMGDMAEREGFALLIFGPLDEWLCEALDTHGIDFCNTRERIPADAYPKAFGVHKGHPAPEGHRVLGELLEQELRDRGHL